MVAGFTRRDFLWALGGPAIAQLPAMKATNRPIKNCGSSAIWDTPLAARACRQNAPAMPSGSPSHVTAALNFCCTSSANQVIGPRAMGRWNMTVLAASGFPLILIHEFRKWRNVIWNRICCVESSPPQCLRPIQF